jgi:phosphate transport system permease protein
MTAEAEYLPAPVLPQPGRRPSLDLLFRFASVAAATLLLAALGGVLVSLAIGGWPALQKFGVGFLFDTTWNPVTDVYGGAGPIVGTLITSVLALALALPVAFGVAIFLTEFCPKPLAEPIGVAVQLLAGVPSIIFGMWGLFVLAPWFAGHVQLPLIMAAPPGSLLEKIVAGAPNGANVFTASLILALMILPYIASVSRELFLSVPPQVKEAAYGLGCTSLEVLTRVVMPYVRQGLVGVTMLGLGRAMGETMAVTFIIGNSHDVPTSLFTSSSTIASTIANELLEAGPMHSSALLLLGLVLFAMTFTVLAIARALLATQRQA